MRSIFRIIVTYLHVLLAPPDNTAGYVGMKCRSFLQIQTDQTSSEMQDGLVLQGPGWFFKARVGPSRPELVLQRPSWFFNARVGSDQCDDVTPLISTPGSSAVSWDSTDHN